MGYFRHVFLVYLDLGLDLRMLARLLALSWVMDCHRPNAFPSTEGFLAMLAAAGRVQGEFERPKSPGSV